MIGIMCSNGWLQNSAGGMKTFKNSKAAQEFIEEAEERGLDLTDLNLSLVYIADGDEGIKQ